ncbi:hypothetical protein [Cellulomonas hominis]|uniref:hypothetical protein n=1 Tax=Cellulomonas hominis TaxID=156981 RepID=UPI001B916C38|nr:hypothetical protein [Cellulomonas hominis]VTR76312.1 hypothetical protein CHMI_01069 [Cellulomonas hominis]
MRPPSLRTAARALPLCLLVGITAAQVVRTDDVRIEFDGVTFALEVAGSTSPGWEPAPSDWRPTTGTWTLGLADDVLEPGAALDLRVAVRNVSGAPAAVVVSLADPDPAAGDVFGALDVTVSESGRTLASGPASSLRVALPDLVAPDAADERVLDVRVTTPDGAGWSGARTGVQLVVEGTSR